MPKFELLLFVSILTLGRAVGFPGSLHPGLILRLSTKGANYARDIAAKLLDHEFRNLNIGDHTDTHLGEGETQLTYIKVTEYSPPTYEPLVVGNSRIGLDMKDCGMTFNADWRGKIKIGIPLEDSGTINATASGISLLVRGSLVNSNGLPKISNVTCTCTVGSFKIHSITMKKFGKLLHKFRHILGIYIKPQIISEIETKSKLFIETWLNNELKSFPGIISLEGNFKLNNQMIAHPTLSSSEMSATSLHKGSSIIYVTFARKLASLVIAWKGIYDGRAMATVRFALRSHSPAIRNLLPGSYERSELSWSEALALRNLWKIPKGEISYLGDGGTPYLPRPVITDSSNARMLYFYASDFVLNSFFFSAHEHGRFKYNITSQDSQKTTEYLRVSCSAGEMCLGSVLPQLRTAFPNFVGSLTLESLIHPTARFSPGKATVSTLGKISLHVRKENVSKKVLSCNVLLHAAMVPTIDKVSHKVIGEVKITRFLTKLTDSSIPELLLPESKVLLRSVERLLIPILETLGNKYSGKGLKLPLLKGMGITDADIQLKEGTIEIGTDLSYTKP